MLKIIFEKIEDEGIEVVEDLKFFKYWVIFDIEVYYKKIMNFLEKWEKLEFKV